MKTIEQLCRELPDSEAELRARSWEFHSELCRTVLGWHEWDGEGDYDGDYPMFCVWDLDGYATVYEEDGQGDFNRCYRAFDIDGAKLATDALRSRCVVRVTIGYDGSATCEIQVYDVGFSEILAGFMVQASTEELARSAAAYLAALAMEKS